MNKLADYITRLEAAQKYVRKSTLAQTTGQAVDNPMSQDSTTKELNKKPTVIVSATVPQNPSQYANLLWYEIIAHKE